MSNEKQVHRLIVFDTELYKQFTQQSVKRGYLLRRATEAAIKIWLSMTIEEQFSWMEEEK